MTPVVADTHALIWFLFTPQTLSKRAFEALNDAVQSGGIYLASISIVEIVYLIEKGKLPSNSLQRLIAPSFTIHKLHLRLFHLTSQSQQPCSRFLEWRCQICPTGLSPQQRFTEGYHS